VKELITRTIAGIVFITIVIAAILFSEISFMLLFALVSLLGLKEYLAITNKLSIASSVLLALLSASTPVFTYLIVSEQLPSHWMLVLPLLFVFLFASVLFRIKVAMTEALGNITLFFIWVSVPLTLFLLTGRAIENGQYNPYIPLSIIAMTWVYDTSAYLTGILLGKHKMFPSLSPHKSWEGFIGGILITATVAALTGPLTGYLNPGQWAITGAVGAIASMLGDLIESRFKREYAIKDSGKIIPGHGGILDRFDSLLFSVPAIYAMFLIFRI